MVLLPCRLNDCESARVQISLPCIWPIRALTPCATLMTPEWELVNEDIFKGWRVIHVRLRNSTERS